MSALYWDHYAGQQVAQHWNVEPECAQALHAAAPCLMTWDDHEVENDYANEWSQRVETKPEDFLHRRAAAYQAYYEHMPLRARSMPQGTGLRLFDRFRFGDLVNFWVLDGRQYRTKQPCELPRFRGGHVAPDSCTERVDPQRTYLGVEGDCLWHHLSLLGLKVPIALLNRADRNPVTTGSVVAMARTSAYLQMQP